MRRRVLLVALGGLFCTVVALAGASSADAAVRGVDASRPKPKPVARCVVPRGWTLVANDAQAVVIKHRVKHTVPGTAPPNYFIWSWRYCLRNAGRFQSLFNDEGRSSGERGDIVRHRSLVLSGVYVAYQITTQVGGGRYGCSQTVSVYDLSTRKGTDVSSYDCFITGLDIGPLRVNSRGFAAWRVTTYPVSPTYNTLNGISCPAVSLCVATDNAANILTATRPTEGRSAWAFTKPSLGGGLVSCPTIAFCEIAGANVSLSSTNPTGGAGAWIASPMPEVPGNAYSGLSCASRSLCVAVGGNTIATSTNPISATNTWTQITLPGAKDLRGVSCPSKSLCVVTDFQLGKIFASTDPTGGASAWKRVLTKQVAFQAISCPSISLCVAVASVPLADSDAFVTSTNPTGGTRSWKTVRLPSVLIWNISCASRALCVAAGEDGIDTTTNPTGGVSAWKVHNMPQIRVDGVSCPSTSLCAATTMEGLIGTSTQPAARGNSWNFQFVDAAEDCAFTTPCAAQQIYAYDSQGTRQRDSTPPGSVLALDNLQLNGNLVTWTHNGTPRQAQLG